MHISIKGSKTNYTPGMAAFAVPRHIEISLCRTLRYVTRPVSMKNGIEQCLRMMLDQRQLFHTTVHCRRKHIDSKTPRPAIKFGLKAKKKQMELVQIWRDMTVRELAGAAKKDIESVFEALNIASSTYHHNSPDFVINNPTIIQEVVKIFGKKFETISRPGVTKDSNDDSKDVVKRPPPDPAVLIKRHPVVTIMGHVDHGKTTLLDSLRSTSVVATEFGGITQHIGAFNVTLETGERITFLDTPGHAAFSAMRARGAYVTDIVILVVAADDGVMEQTIQSIEMAKAANVPIIVAINKIDKPEADIDRTKRMLAQNGIQVEDLGGDVQSVNISALKKINIYNLTEAVAAQAELMNITGDPTGLVEAVVIEASNDPGRGKLATILIQRGTLKKSAILVCGKAWAKVRSMFNEDGNPVVCGKLSEAVQVIGWRELPNAGDEILEVESEKQAHAVIKYRVSKEFEITAMEHSKAAAEKMKKHLDEYKENLARKRALGIRYKMKSSGQRQKEIVNEDNMSINIIVKGDVGGSVEAILDVLDTYSEEDKCRLNLIHYGVGNVTENDIDLASAFKAIIYSFNVDTPNQVKSLAKQESIPIRNFNVIYKLIDNLKDEINSKLPLLQVEEVIGEANVLQQFEVSEGRRKVPVAGSRCVKGVLKKSAMFKLVRGDEVVHTGPLESMRHIKTEVDSIKNGVECGIRFKDSEISFQPGDTLICFKLIDQPQKCKWDPGF
ncbi:translation initiation factor IF-2, mitochondrial [Athalia rosae]|uniref:translation initiation factor IF-2, mitochondrial n=1 Tax=Athalia rosae TaxID=37344 RepID=UPI0020338B4C|nr:translation initiation factor IF-2, mitochondrial [Athalia rosae]